MPVLYLAREWQYRIVERRTHIGFWLDGNYGANVVG
jgi:hypothetical protein